MAITVKEAIKELKKMPKDAPLYLVWEGSSPREAHSIEERREKIINNGQPFVVIERHKNTIHPSRPIEEREKPPSRRSAALGMGVLILAACLPPGFLSPTGSG